MGKVPENFHGVAGRSGRKTAFEEGNKIAVINKLWEKINTKVSAGEELSEYEEKLVLALLPKTIQTKQDITTDGESLQPLLVKFITDENGRDSNRISEAI